jgi:hypothetical protein
LKYHITLIGAKKKKEHPNLAIIEYQSNGYRNNGK